MTAYIPSHAKIIKCTHQHDNSQKSVTNIPVDTPAIVVFGGELTTDPHTANSYSKMLHRVLDEEQISGMNIYSVAYEFASHSPHLERADLFRRAGRKLQFPDDPIARAALQARMDEMQQQEPTPKYVSELYDILIRPRIFDANGRPLPLNIAVRNMRHVIFYAHSHGPAVIRQLGERMHDELLAAGRNPEQIARIQRNLLVIQHAPLTPLNNARFNTLSFASAEDSSMLNHGNQFAQYMSDNSADVVPAFFAGDSHGNVFVVRRVRHVPMGEHDHRGLLASDRDKLATTDEGEILFTAERNALVRGVRNMRLGRAIPSVRTLTNGNGIDFDQMKRNGDVLFNIMLTDLRRQNSIRAHQK